jgi:hypothetical protein
MGYDFHISEAKEKAIKSHPVISLNEEEHTFIFKEQAEITNKFPMFRSMEDYYRDTTFFNSSLINLKSELHELERLLDNGKCRDFVKEMLQIVESAEKEKMDIYCFCD